MTYWDPKLIKTLYLRKNIKKIKKKTDKQIIEELKIKLKKKDEELINIKKLLIKILD